MAVDFHSGQKRKPADSLEPAGLSGFSFKDKLCMNNYTKTRMAVFESKGTNPANSNIYPSQSNVDKK